VKLEPSRLSLALPIAARGPLQPPPAAIPPQRKCSACGADDVIHRREGHYEANAEPVEEHLVTIDIRFLKTPAEFTPRNRAKGWTLFKFQGRDAMKRFICLPCLLGQREMQREQKRKREAELNQTHGDSYWLAVCGE